MTGEVKKFTTTFTYMEDSAFRSVHLYLMKTKLPVRDAVKDALVAFHYPEAARTKSAIELCRRLLERRLFDLDAIEQKISEETQESLPAPVSPELQPISASLDQIGAFEDNF